MPLNMGLGVQQVQCGQCHSYSGHLFEILGPEYGVTDGLMMKNDFCNNLVSKCEGQIIFPDYDDGDSYCDKHTGGSDNTDNFWSYPYTEREYCRIKRQTHVLKVCTSTLIVAWGLSVTMGRLIIESKLEVRRHVSSETRS